MLAWFITLGLLLPAYALAQSPGIQCFVPGECLDSQILDTVSTNSSRTCLHHCQKIQGCEWFTFYADSKICTSLSGCLDLSPKKCPGNCISGENECPEFQCGLQGRCFGALEGIRKVGSARECGTICGNRLECFWHTYNPSQASCTLTNDCPALDKSCADCEVSETQCEGQGDGQTTVLEDSAVIPPSYALMFIGKSPHVLNLTDLKPAVCQDTPRIDHGTEAERITLRWTNSLFLITVLRKSEMAYCERFDVEQREWLRASELKWSSQHYVDGVFTRLGDGSLFFLNVLGNSSFYVNGLGVHNGPETLTFVTGSKPEGICLTTIRDNDVFISGGSSINGPSKTSLRSAKHINPKTKAVVSLPDMPQNLTNHTCSTYVTKEGPKVLILGGSTDFLGIKRNKLYYVFDWTTQKYTKGDGAKFTIPFYSTLGPTIPLGDKVLVCIRLGLYMDQLYKFDPLNPESVLLLGGSIVGKFSQKNPNHPPILLHNIEDLPCK